MMEKDIFFDYLTLKSVDSSRQEDGLRNYEY